MTVRPAVASPALPQVELHLHRPDDPAIGIVVSNERCTASAKSASFTRHVAIDVSGSRLAGAMRPGQSFGVLPPGADERGREHKLRLYSLASPSGGENDDRNVIATTVKRTIDEHWNDHRLFLGVASNYLCDLQAGDEVRLTGPNGKRFLLPAQPSDHDYVFFATGTGIAPFRGMIMDLLASDVDTRITLIMGAPYRTDLLYHTELEALALDDRFTYVTAISREDQGGTGRAYVQDRIGPDRRLTEQLQSERTLVYICGIAGMELGILSRLHAVLGDAAQQYVDVDEGLADSGERWTRRMLHKQVRPTRRVLLEVYS